MCNIYSRYLFVIAHTYAQFCVLKDCILGCNLSRVSTYEGWTIISFVINMNLFFFCCCCCRCCYSRLLPSLSCVCLFRRRSFWLADYISLVRSFICGGAIYYILYMIRIYTQHLRLCVNGRERERQACTRRWTQNAHAEKLGYYFYDIYISAIFARAQGSYSLSMCASPVKSELLAILKELVWMGPSNTLGSEYIPIWH